LLFYTFFLSFSFILLHYYYNMKNPYQRIHCVNLILH
jgi:hypothetical protein